MKGPQPLRLQSAGPPLTARGENFRSGACPWRYLTQMLPTVSRQAATNARREG